MKRIPLILLFIAILASSCKPVNEINTDSSRKLSFSSDTVLFDTVFTSLGSATQQLMVYNDYDDDMKISSIRLFGGEQSRFRINVDGEAGLEFYDKLIPANDSLFAYMQVTIDPTDSNTPFLVEDSIEFVTNGNRQVVKILAYGQNVHYIIADTKIGEYPKFKIVADSLDVIHWTNDKPYVIYGYALINSYGTLHIDAGTRVYIHDGGGIWSWSDGQLLVDGTQEQPVVIQGDRLEPYYQDQPGQWDRIWLMDGRTGADHVINHAIIRNAFIGIQAESFLKATPCALRVYNTIIENHTGCGILSRYYAIESSNTVIDNCGQYAFAVQYGGDYLLRHMTIGNNWWQSPRTTASMFVNNYGEDVDGSLYEYPFHLEMQNSILHGALENEFSTDLIANEVDTTYLISYCLVKSATRCHDTVAFRNCIFNQDPMFVDYRSFDLHIEDAFSPAIGTGSPIVAQDIPYDMEGNSRLGVPDLGAYQH